jgi:hypothetical protein
LRFTSFFLPLPPSSLPSTRRPRYMCSGSERARSAPLSPNMGLVFSTVDIVFPLLGNGMLLQMIHFHPCLELPVSL